MKKMLLAGFWVVFAATLGFQTSTAEMVSVTDDDGNDFGATSGLAIDFDSTTGIAADWVPDLVAGTTYSVDSVTLFANGATSTEAVYLGVYSTLTADPVPDGNATLGGFLGVSDSAIAFNDGSTGTGPRTWNFTNVFVTAGSEAGNVSQFSGGNATQLDAGEVISGDGMLFFVYQAGTDALTELPVVGASDAFKYRRIDNATGGSIDDELAAVLQGGNGGATGVDVFKTDRSPEYQASVTEIPEPASLALAVLGILVGWLLCRRIDR